MTLFPEKVLESSHTPRVCPLTQTRVLLADLESSKEYSPVSHGLCGLRKDPLRGSPTSGRNGLTAGFPGAANPARPHREPESTLLELAFAGSVGQDRPRDSLEEKEPERPHALVPSGDRDSFPACSEPAPQDRTGGVGPAWSPCSGGGNNHIQTNSGWQQSTN